MIGSLGDFIFTASSEQVKTFKDLTTDKGVRYGSHSTIDGKPRLEFTGPELDSISLKLFWRVEDKVNPVKEIEYLEKALNKGEILTFLIGGKRVGDTGRYIIKSIKNSHTRIDNKGNFLAVEYDLSLEEYVEDNPNEKDESSDENAVSKDKENVIEIDLNKKGKDDEDKHIEKYSTTSLIV